MSAPVAVATPEATAASSSADERLRERLEHRLLPVPAAGPHVLGGSLSGEAITAAEGDDLLSTGEDWELA